MSKKLYPSLHTDILEQNLRLKKINCSTNSIQYLKAKKLLTIIKLKSIKRNPRHIKLSIV